MAIVSRAHPLGPLLLVALLASLTSCSPSGTSVASGERSVELTRTAKVLVAPGTSKVLGTVRLPRAILNGETSGSLGDLVMAPQAALRLLDETGSPFPDTGGKTTNASGEFDFPRVPLGVTMTLEADVPVGDRTLRLRKVLRPTEALTCAHVDLATTLVADRLLSPTPLLAPDPGLAGAELLNLFVPSRTLETEALVRSALAQGPSASLGGLVTDLTRGDTSAKLEELAQQHPGILAAYMGAFERPDTSLEIRLRTSAVGTNSIGIETRHPLFGVASVTVLGAPAGTTRMEYWAKSDTQRKIAESTAPGSWEATIDTWTLLDGDVTLDTIAILDSGKKVLVGRSYLRIQNTVASHCPLP